MSNTKRLSLVVLLVSVVLIQSLVVISAQDNSDIYVVEPPTFFERILRIFSDLDFSIVGEDNRADENARHSFVVEQWDTFEKTTSETRSLCGGASGLWNIYGVIGSQWYPRTEMIDHVLFACAFNADGEGTDLDKCIAELYCMPYQYPPNKAACEEAIGPGSEPQVIHDVDDEVPLYDVANSRFADSYVACTNACTGSPITCWRQEGDSCRSRTYDCGYITYPECPSARPYKSKSSCEADIDSSCTPNWNTGDWSNCINGQRSRTVTDLNNCGIVSGRPDSTQACTVSGTGGDDDSGSGDSGGSDSGDSGGGDSGTGGSSDDPALNVELTILSVNPTQVKPGSEVDIKMRIKNMRPNPSFFQEQQLLVEGGIIPRKTAEDWFGKSQIDELFTVSPLIFSRDSLKSGVCCEGQPNIDSAFLAFGNDEVRDVTVTVKAPTSSTGDLCPIDGGTQYWDSSSIDYVAYALVKNKCFKDGGIESTYVLRQVSVSDSNSNTGGSFVDGAECDPDKAYQCASGVCENQGNFFVRDYRCAVGGSGGTGATGADFATDPGARQKGLTKSQISSATIDSLMQSVCVTSDQCEDGSQCESLQALKEDDAISDIKAREIADSLSNRITNSVGVASGISATVACGVIAGPATGPAAIPICGAVGIVTGLGLNSFFDSIAEADLEKTGICTVESTGLQDFINNLGSSIKITGNENTDGLIVLIGGFVLLIIFLNAFSGGGRR